MIPRLPDNLSAAFETAFQEARSAITPGCSEAIRTAILLQLAGLNPGARPLDLSEATRISPHRLSSALKLLVTARLVANRDDPTNRRFRNYYNTKLGNEEVSRLLGSKGFDVNPTDLPHLVLGQVRYRDLTRAHPSEMPHQE